MVVLRPTGRRKWYEMFLLNVFLSSVLIVSLLSEVLAHEGNLLLRLTILLRCTILDSNGEIFSSRSQCSGNLGEHRIWQPCLPTAAFFLLSLYMERKRIPWKIIMGEKTAPEPHRRYGEVLLDLAHCMGLAGVRALVESSGAAVQAHEQCQGAAGAGESTRLVDARILTSKGAALQRRGDASWEAQWWQPRSGKSPVWWMSTVMRQVCRSGPASGQDSNWGQTQCSDCQASL